MNYLSRTTCLRSPWLASLLSLSLLAGCQSSGQNDLVTRELRAQEDQIYAMEDYLAQYQQLLCQYRAENAALRRQIRENDSDNSLPAPAERDSSPAKTEKPTSPSGPSFRSPGSTPLQSEPNQSPAELEIEVIEPEVPPLEETTKPLPGTQSQHQPPEHDSAVLAAAYEESLSHTDETGESASAGGNSATDPLAAVEPIHTMSELLHDSITPPKFVQLRGEVVANETGGGPRLQVDVEPMTVTLEPTRFAGELSFMVIDASDGGDRPVSLARWDFSADDAQAVLEEMPNHQTMRYHLELPPDVPTNGKTELWVRLMPADGEKVLGHARVNLSRPGRFESMVGGAAPREEWDDNRPGGSVAAIADRNNSIPTPAFDQGDYEGWTIARPDQPLNSSASDRGVSNAAWRAATQPLPMVVAEAMAVERNLTEIQHAAFVEPVPPSPTQPASLNRTTPQWTPERNAASASDAKTMGVVPQAAKPPARPVWSPLR